MTPVRLLPRRPGRQSAAAGAAPSSPEPAAAPLAAGSPEPAADPLGVGPDPGVPARDGRRTGPPAGRTAIVVAVLVALVVMLGAPLRSWFVQRGDLAAARASLAAADAELEDLRNGIEQWQDPLFVQEQARLRLNYVLPGEVGVIVGEPQQAQPGGPDAPRDWFAALWRSVESASGRSDAQAAADPLRVRPEAPR